MRVNALRDALRDADKLLLPDRKAGAKCNGPPGFRPQYHEKYYASFIIDLDGNNIECVYFDL